VGFTKRPELGPFGRRPTDNFPQLTGPLVNLDDDQSTPIKMDSGAGSDFRDERVRLTGFLTVLTENEFALEIRPRPLHALSGRFRPGFDLAEAVLDSAFWVRPSTSGPNPYLTGALGRVLAGRFTERLAKRVAYTRAEARSHVAARVAVCRCLRLETQRSQSGTATAFPSSTRRHIRTGTL
jgi:hypothetical protein